MRLLAKILAVATGAPRHFPEPERATGSWTHRAFRAFERVFGRRHGIRAEATTAVRFEGGRKVVVRQFHTWESLLAHAESSLRAAARRAARLDLTFGLRDIRIAVPALAVGPSFGLPSALPYRFAIAFDAAATNAGDGSDTSLTVSHTCAGSNRIIWGAHAKEIAGTCTGMTYNSVALAQAVTKTYTARTEQADLWYLIAPATGANSLVASYSDSLAVRLTAMSYSGAKQALVPDATASGENATSPLTVANTVVRANSWMVMSMYSQRLITASTGVTTRAGGAGAAQSIAGDSGGPVPAGANSMSCTLSGAAAGNVMVVASFPPFEVYTVSADVGGFTLTGIAAALRQFKLVAAAASFALSGADAALKLFTWIARTRPTSTWTPIDRSDQS